MEVKPQDWRCSTGGRLKRTTRTMAPGTGRRSISRATWTSTRRASERKRPQVYLPNYPVVSIKSLRRFKESDVKERAYALDSPFGKEDGETIQLNPFRHAEGWCYIKIRHI